MIDFRANNNIDRTHTPPSRYMPAIMIAYMIALAQETTRASNKPDHRRVLPIWYRHDNIQHELLLKASDPSINETGVGQTLEWIQRTANALRNSDDIWYDRRGFLGLRKVDIGLIQQNEYTEWSEPVEGEPTDNIPRPGAP